MEFLAKVAALALTVIASVFTDVQPAVAPAKPAPAVAQAASTVRHFEPPVVTVVVIRPVMPTRPDHESERFLQWIRAAQQGSKPVAQEPWFTRTDEFTVPSLKESVNILETLLSNQGASF